MDDAASLRALLRICPDLSHEIMVYLIFDLRCSVDIDIVLMALKLPDLLLSDDASLGLSPCLLCTSENIVFISSDP